MTSRHANGRYPIGQSRGEIIPAIGLPVMNKFGREAARTVREYRDDQETTSSFIKELGELHLNLYRNVVDTNGFDRTLAWFRKEHGSDAVKSVVLWIAPVTYTEYFAEFEW